MYDDTTEQTHPVNVSHTHVIVQYWVPQNSYGMRKTAVQVLNMYGLKLCLISWLDYYDARPTSEFDCHMYQIY